MRLFKRSIMGILFTLFVLTTLLGFTCSLPQTLDRPKCQQSELISGLCMSKSLDIALTQTACPAMEDRYKAVVNQAESYLGKIKPSKFKVVLLDLDETLVNNFAYYNAQKGFSRDTFATWVASNKNGPFHPSVLSFAQMAKAKGFSVMFVTGRTSKMAHDTLEQVGSIAWDGVYFRPERDNLPSIRYKQAIRQMLRGVGYQIVVNMGDQYSDHDLPADPKRGEFLLPNVMYSIP